MEWQVIVALAIAIPVILFPAAFIWCLNIGGMYAAIRKARERRVIREKSTRALAKTKQVATAHRSCYTDQ